MRYLQETAESSKRLSEAAKAATPDVAWRKIASFRNVLVHEYLGVDMKTVYKAAQTHLPPLKKALQEMQEK